jgi:enamine deaminase RidA (YjgF/YER057c/UK114 family)
MSTDPGRAAGLPALPNPPRVVFTSSVASFSGGQERRLEDDARQLPGNSYGAEKAIGRAAAAGRSPQGLPRCGKHPPADRDHPPRAAEQGGVSFVSRDPAGAAARPRDRPAGAGGFRGLDLLAAAGGGVVPACHDDGHRPARPRPRHQPAGAERDGRQDAERAAEVAGPAARAQGAARARPGDRGIVGTWPASFTAERARRLHGFSEQESLEEIVQAFIEDDLAATRPSAASDAGDRPLLLPDAPQRVAPFSHARARGDFPLRHRPDADAARAAGMRLVEGGIEAQTLQVIANLKTVLAGSGGQWERTVFARVYLTAFERDYAAMNAVWEASFPPAACPPAPASASPRWR